MSAHDSGLLCSLPVNESVDRCTTPFYDPACLKTEGLV